MAEWALERRPGKWAEWVEWAAWMAWVEWAELSSLTGGRVGRRERGGRGGVYGHGAGMRRASRQAARHGGGDFCGICLRLRPGERRAEDEVKEEEEEDKDGECGRVWG